MTACQNDDRTLSVGDILKSLSQQYSALVLWKMRKTNRNETIASGFNKKWRLMIHCVCCLFVYSRAWSQDWLMRRNTSSSQLLITLLLGKISCWSALWRAINTRVRGNKSALSWSRDRAFRLVIREQNIFSCRATTTAEQFRLNICQADVLCKSNENRFLSSY